MRLHRSYTTWGAAPWAAIGFAICAALVVGVVTTEPQTDVGQLGDAITVLAVVALAAVAVRWRRSEPTDRDLQMLSELARLTSRVPDARQQVFDVARELLDADAAVMFVVRDGNLESEGSSPPGLPRLRIPLTVERSIVTRAFRSGELLFARGGGLLDLPAVAELGARSALAAPVSRGGERLGVCVWLWRRARRRITPRERYLAALLAEEKGIVLERARLFGVAEQLTRAQVRARLARDLHDSVAQDLAVLGTYIDAAQRALEREPALLPEVLELMEAHAAKAHEEMREVLEALRVDRPVVELSIADVVGALVTGFRERHPDIELELDVVEEPGVEVRAAVRETVYFVLREALHNAATHADAQRVRVGVHSGRDGLTLEVHDDGHGFDVGAAPPGRHGLVGMRERARLAGGELELRSARGAGTTVRLHLDRPPEQPTTQTLVL